MEFPGVRLPGTAFIPRLPGQREERSYMNENEQRREELLKRLDNLEPCRDNPVYLAEIRAIRKELAELNAED